MPNRFINNTHINKEVNNLNLSDSISQNRVILLLTEGVMIFLTLPLQFFNLWFQRKLISFIYYLLIKLLKLILIFSDFAFMQHFFQTNFRNSLFFPYYFKDIWVLSWSQNTQLIKLNLKKIFLWIFNKKNGLWWNYIFLDLISWNLNLHTRKYFDSFEGKNKEVDWFTYFYP